VNACAGCLCWQVHESTKDHCKAKDLIFAHSESCSSAM
jgi:hypothetical protein